MIPLPDPHKDSGESPFFSHVLDHVRWMSAFVVLIGHARSLFFGAYTRVEDPNLVQKIFYGVTNFQDEAVLSFFVISGYLIGGRVIRQARSGSFNPRRYVVARLTRLYIVLLPVLAFSFAISQLGFCEREAASTWVAGMFYLQDITAPTPNCFAPLWSLANEFWYYTFALLAALVTVQRTLVISAFVVIIAFLFYFDGMDSRNILAYLPVWGFGVLLVGGRRMSGLTWPPALCALLFAAALLISRSYVIEEWYVLRDYLTGGTLMLLLLAWRAQGARGEGRIVLPRFGFQMAAFSYSLYLLHWPLLTLIRWIVRDRQVLVLPLNPDAPISYLIYAAIVGVCLLAAFVLAQLTEKHTARVRSAVYRKLPAGP